MTDNNKPVDEELTGKLQQLYWNAKNMHDKACLSVWKRAWLKITRKYY